MSDLIDDLIEAARLLGATQAKKGIGCYTREDARFERAMHESISDKAKRLTSERDNARERFERAANLLVGIHALLYPPPVTLPDGRTLVFRPENPDPHTVLQTLSDRIRALPDEIAAINEAKEQR